MNSWQDKYAPQKFEELLIPLDTPLVPINYLLEQFAKTGNCMYSGFVLYGNGGTGKTAFLNFIKQTQNWHIHRITDLGAGKDEIDAIEKEIDLCSREFFKQKVLIEANELSKSSMAFRDGLRGIIDRNRGNVFILATDNDIQKLLYDNPQLIGVRRLLAIDWDLIPKARIVERGIQILKAENCYWCGTHTRLVELADKYSPDIGSVLQLLQLYVESL